MPTYSRPRAMRCTGSPVPVAARTGPRRARTGREAPGEEPAQIHAARRSSPISPSAGRCGRTAPAPPARVSGRGSSAGVAFVGRDREVQVVVERNDVLADAVVAGEGRVRGVVADGHDAERR